MRTTTKKLARGSDGELPSLEYMHYRGPAGPIGYVPSHSRFLRMLWYNRAGGSVLNIATERYCVNRGRPYIGHTAFE